MKKSAYFIIFLIFFTNLSAQHLNGIYSVGQGGNFETIGDVLDSAFQTGLSGHVILELSNSYNPSLEIFPLIIKQYFGLYSEHTLTIRPAIDTDSIVFTFSGVNGFLFYGCSYVIIDGRRGGAGNEISLKIKTTGSASAINLIEDAHHNTIKFVEISGDNTSDNLLQVSSGHIFGTNYNKISSCRFKSLQASSFPKTAVSISGGYMIPNCGNILEDCDISDFNNTGIYISGLADATIVKNCKLYQTSPANSVSLSAIKIVTATNTVISGNEIIGFASSSPGYSELNGISVETESFFTDGSIIIYNNFISLSPADEASSTTISGIKYAGKRGCSFEAYNNTILISGNDDYGRFSYCINKSDSASIFTVKNNILINRRVTQSCPGKQFCLNVPVILGFHSNYNLMHNGDNSASVGHWEGTDLYSFEDWQNISKEDTHSVFIPAEFISNYDLHITGSSLGNSGFIALPISEILYDADGELRSLTFPYKGADERPDYPLPVELISFTANITNDGIRLTWETASELNNYGFEIERKSESIWETLSFIPGRINSSEKSFYTFTDKVNDGVFSYRLKQIDLGGDYIYSNEILVDVKSDMKFTLGQNYPNPFNPSTTIEYTISEKNLTTLKIFDITGQLVSTLVNQVLDKGSYSVNFNPVNLPCGIYFYELHSGNNRLINKMCLIK